MVGQEEGKGQDDERSGRHTSLPYIITVMHSATYDVAESSPYGEASIPKTGLLDVRKEVEGNTGVNGRVAVPVKDHDGLKRHRVNHRAGTEV